MQPPHPLISCGKFPGVEATPQTQKHVRELVEKAVGNIPNAKKNNHVSVGGVGSKDYEFAYYNPHNARFYFRYLKNQGVGRGRLSELRVINKSEFCHNDFFGCRVVVKKELIEITNKVDKDRRFKISGSADLRREQVVDAVAVLEREAIAVLKEFVKRFSGESDFVCVKMWIPDNKILHDRIVDSIPADVTFRNEVVKKVYLTSPSNVEVSSPVQAANTFRNLALYDYAPTIAKELEEIRSAVMSRPASFVSTLESLKMDVRVFPDDVLEREREVLQLNDAEKAEFTDWFFDEFGVGV